MMKRALAVTLLLVASTASAQQPQPPPAGAPRTSEIGRPLVRNYTPEEYHGGGQNWAIVQDKRGVLYVATNGALLEFDGAAWRRIPLSSLVTVARSWRSTTAGRIYVGAVNELGYLAPNQAGEMHFVSLLDKLPADARQMAVVWRTMVTPGGIVFQSDTAMYRWSGGTFAILKAPSRFRRASVVDGRVYVVTPENGLNVVENDRLRPLPGTERLVNEPFPVLLRYDETRLLVGTRGDGLFLYDGTALVPFTTELDAWMKQAQLYRGTSLPDGTFALSTTSAGMGIVDRQGKRVALVNRAAGLPSDVVYYTMQDEEGALWLATDIGVARVETPSPVSFFDKDDGLPGSVTAAIRHDGRLYLAMQTGIQYLDAGPGRAERPRIRPIEKQPGQPVLGLRRDAGRRAWGCQPSSRPATKVSTRCRVPERSQSRRPRTSPTTRTPCACRRSTRRGSGSACGTGSGRSGTSAGAGRTKGASRASPSTCARSSRTPTARSGRAPRRRASSVSGSRAGRPPRCPGRRRPSSASRRRRVSPKAA